MTSAKRVQARQAVSCFPVENVLTSSWDRPTDLQENEIHVWGFILEGKEASVERCVSWLDDRERARGTRFVRTEDRRRYALAHGSLRAVLGRYMRLDPSALEYRYAETGKPFVTQRLRSGDALAFSLSHSHGRMLVALSRSRELGVDLELIRRDIEAGKLADRFFCHTERAAMAQSGTKREHETFFRYWVAKEAVLKAQGVGISSLQDCEILLNRAGARTAIRATPGSAVQPDWTVHFLSCESEWEGAVAAKGDNWIVRPQSAG